MALILAAPASGKTTFIKKYDGCMSLVDGDVLIPIPDDRPDPADWTQDERQSHMQGFQSYTMSNPGMICIGFSEVYIETFDMGCIPTVIVEVAENDFNENVNCRHRNLRKGCNPRPAYYYSSQRVYLRQLANAHGLRIYTSFKNAVDALTATLPFYQAPSATSNVDGIVSLINQNGFCIVPKLLSQQSMLDLQQKESALSRSGARLSNHLSNSMPRNTPALKDTIHQYLNPHLNEDKDKSTLHVARSLLSLMDKLLGVDLSKHERENAFLFNDTLLTKTKDHRRCLHWHQDFSFWPLSENSQVLVVWIPLTPVKEDNGAVSVAVGSHRSPLGPIINLSTGVSDDTNSKKEDFVSGLSVFDISCLELNAGDALIFHPNLYHMSHPNMTENNRVAWSSVWVNPDAHWDPSRVPAHPRSKKVMQGARVGQFDWEQTPK